MHPKKYSSPPLMTAANLLDFHFPAEKRAAAPKTVLIFMNKPVLAYAVSLIRGKQSNRIPANVYLPRRGEKNVGLLGNTGVGGAGVVAHLEYLAAWGVKQVVLIGKAGGLTANAHYEDIVIPAKSFRDDGVSAHYLPVEDWAHPSLKLNQTLVESLKQLQRQGKRGLPYPTIHEAPVWTTSAPFRETLAEVNDYGQQGMLAVEMESASLFAAAQALQIEASAILIISDSFSTGSHQISPKQRKIDNQLLAIAQNLIHLFK